MIKYLELTPPEKSVFRQSKIVSIEVSEGQTVTAGTALFRVKSGENEIDLPVEMDGRVVEIIAHVGDTLSLMTPLVLFETEVEDKVEEKPEKSTQEANSAPKAAAKPKAKAAPKAKNEPIKKHTQQSLDLDGTGSQNVEQPEVDTPTEATVSSNKPQNDKTTAPVVVPDIGGDSAQVIEILVKIGDIVTAEQSIVTLESDKASMDVPSPISGVVESIEVQLEQSVSENDVLITVASNDNEQTAANSQAQETSKEELSETVETVETAKTDESAPPSQPETSTQSLDMHVPDIGGDKAKVIEILVAVGDDVDEEQPLITLESDKASMEMPSTAAGKVTAIHAKIDDELGEGDLVVTLTTTATASTPAVESKKADTSPKTETASPASATPAPQPQAQTATPVVSNSSSHASPSVRRFARELGADLSLVQGTGRKNRITKDDVKLFVKQALSGNTFSNLTSQNQGAGIPEIPAVDFSKFGEIEVQPLNKIKRLTAENLHRSWLNVPHVTHNDESDISDLEAFRKDLNKEYAKQDRGIKLSPLAFIVKAVVRALQTYPQFNSSLENGGNNLILKKYFNIGIAVDTPNGLVVPVIKNADKLSISEIAQAMGELAAKARDKKLTPADMSGACFTISSLGGIGGTGFTPIVNAPEVAILGVSRTKRTPVWNGSKFVPGMMLPLSLSYDHRVIDGAEAARFTRFIAEALEDVRRLAV